jgi:hypothetical protein
VTAYDLPVKTSGGIEGADAKEAVPLTISVELVDPPGDAELAGAIEGAIAFGHYHDLDGCQSSTAGGWDTTFRQGTIVLGFVLDPGGAATGAEVVLTDGEPAEAFLACLVSVVEAMVLAPVPLEEPASVHLMLRYGD